MQLIPPDSKFQSNLNGFLRIFSTTTLKYDMVSENGTSIDGLPGEFGQSTLVIDDDGLYGPKPGVDTSYHFDGGGLD